jgi:hypothetical protein
MDGPLSLTRVVRKACVTFEVIDSHGDASTVQVECLAPEMTPRALVGILCNDLLVLCRDTSQGHEPNAPVDLWAVLRMQTVPQPASIVHGNGVCFLDFICNLLNLFVALRLVDNKAVLYFDAPSTSDALNWYRGKSFYHLTSEFKLTYDHQPSICTYQHRKSNPPCLYWVWHYCKASIL